MIQAECHSDDRVVEVEVDATLWAKVAKPDDITNALVANRNGGDYGTDDIAIYMSQIDESVRKMFWYIEVVNEKGGVYMGRLKRATCGFECTLDEDALIRWLQKNRPDVFSVPEMDVSEGSELEDFNFFT